jgi:hypothetical protein
MEVKKHTLYMRKWREENREKIRQQENDIWAKKTPEEKKERYYPNVSKTYRQSHKEEIKEYMKEYRKTDAYKKSYRITNWKKSGVKTDDWDSLYDKYINTWNCECCSVELKEGNFKNKKCLDHDHQSGLFRNIICNRCNVIRGNDDRKNN